MPLQVCFEYLLYIWMCETCSENLTFIWRTLWGSLHIGTAYVPLSSCILIWRGGIFWWTWYLKLSPLSRRLTDVCNSCHILTDDSSVPEEGVDITRDLAFDTTCDTDTSSQPVANANASSEVSDARQHLLQQVLKLKHDLEQKQSETRRKVSHQLSSWQMT